jgi:hypothetical protein
MFSYQCSSVIQTAADNGQCLPGAVPVQTPNTTRLSLYISIFYTANSYSSATYVGFDVLKAVVTVSRLIIVL